MVKRPPTGTIPELPGSYQFKDVHGRVIYVGKASNLSVNACQTTSSRRATCTRAQRGWYVPRRLEVVQQALTQVRRLADVDHRP